MCSNFFRMKLHNRTGQTQFAVHKVDRLTLF